MNESQITSKKSEMLKMKSKKPASGTREWATLNYNFINGCAHDCRYCYSKAMAIRFGRTTRDTWKDEEVNPKQLNPTIKPKDGYTMFPSSHDITPINLIHSLDVLSKLLNKGHRVLIVTKPHLEVVRAICDQFEGYRERIMFRFTIGSVNSETLRFWEPFAPSFEERFLALRYAFENGFSTSVSSEPALDTNNIELVEKVLPYVTDAVWIGKVNRLMGIIKLNCGDDQSTRNAALELEKSQSDAWARQLYEYFKNNHQVKWKDSMKKILGLEWPSEEGLDI